MTGAPSMVLACLVDPDPDADAEAVSVSDWADLVAPQVSLRPVRADLDDPAALTGQTPYALLGAGELGVAAFELAGRLTAAGRGPTRLLVCGCPPPAAEQTPLSCPIVAFAGPELADEMAGWRTASTAGFTLRLLDEFEAPPRGRATPDIALALKEELQVWPY